MVKSVSLVIRITYHSHILTLLGPISFMNQSYEIFVHTFSKTHTLRHSVTHSQKSIYVHNNVQYYIEIEIHNTMKKKVSLPPPSACEQHLVFPSQNASPGTTCSQIWAAKSSVKSLPWPRGSSTMWDIAVLGRDLIPHAGSEWWLENTIPRVRGTPAGLLHKASLLYMYLHV